MSKREQAKAIIDKLPEERVERVLFFLMGVQYDAEIDDDMFCERLVEDYLNDDSDDKHDSISIEQFAKEQGIELL